MNFPTPRIHWALLAGRRQPVSRHFVHDRGDEFADRAGVARPFSIPFLFKSFHDCEVARA